MKPVKRIEIITTSVASDQIRRALEKAGISGYTVFPGLTGQGDRGARDGDELTGVFQNVGFVIACEEARVDTVVDSLRPLLKRVGGICLVSDAQWLTH
jgi:nitrogen regulatory protein PII